MFTLKTCTPVLHNVILYILNQVMSKSLGWQLNTWEYWFCKTQYGFV